MAGLTSLQSKWIPHLQEIPYRFSEPMAKHTSFHIGGPAEIMVFPQNIQQLQKILEASSLLDCKCAILGAGTNILAPDDGVDGVVICLKDSLNEMRLLEDNRLYVAAGVTMARAAVFAANHGLSGMEFAHGIPGTVGGGVYMNAGAYGGEIKDICQSVQVMAKNGQVRQIDAPDMDFSYRHSCLEDSGEIVVSAVFQLASANPEDIRTRMQELMAKRKSSQPLELPSAGSAFKRPVGGYAAALIDQASLRGFQIGGAAVSEKHAGFVVNLNHATAQDVTRLLSSVSDIVFERFGIRLEPEVRIW